MGRRIKGFKYIMHTSLQGQQEICRYLERAIKQPSLINIQYTGMDKKKTQKRLTEKEKDKHTVGLKWTQYSFTRLKYVSSYRGRVKL